MRAREKEGGAETLEYSVDVLPLRSCAESFQRADQASQYGFSVFFEWVDLVGSFAFELDAHEVGVFLQTAYTAFDFLVFQEKHPTFDTRLRFFRVSVRQLHYKNRVLTNWLNATSKLKLVKYFSLSCVLE